MLQRHPLSALFAAYDLKGEDLSNLAESIRDHGQQVPVTLYEGQVLDGWNRCEACRLAGIEPVTLDLAPGQDPWEYVKGANMLRRHMSPAERVAVMLKKNQLGIGANNQVIKIDHPSQDDAPSVREIQKDLEVSFGTAQKAKRIAKAQDPALVDALSEKRVSLDEAAKLAKLPEPERRAALEAPKVVPLKPAPKPEPFENPEELERLRAENESLKDRLAEIAQVLADTQEELETARRALDAEDLLVQFDKEIKRAQEQARVVQSRNNGLMNENADLKGRLKSALRKVERLEKAAKESAA